MIFTQGNKGSATILIVLIAGVILSVGLGFNWLVKQHIKAADGLKNKAEAILKARSAYDTLIYLMLNGRFFQKEVMLSGVGHVTAIKAIPLNGEEISLADGVRVRVQESNGRMSLSAIDYLALERLIKETAGMDNAEIPAESLLDWIDQDDFSRVNGAEKFYYQGNRVPYQPRNYPLQYKDEISFVRGFDRELFRKVESYLTILPTTGFNPNTASDKLLKAKLEIDEQALNKLKDYLANKTLSSNSELFFLTGRRLSSSGEDINFLPSRFVEIEVNVGAPNSLYRINAGVQLASNQHTPYNILYWHED